MFASQISSMLDKSRPRGSDGRAALEPLGQLSRAQGGTLAHEEALAAGDVKNMVSSSTSYITLY